MQIVSVQYLNNDQDSIRVEGNNGKTYIAPWPCYTWLGEAVAEWITQDNTIADAPADQAANEARGIRNELLRESDWTQMADCQLSNQKITEWTAYRQLLRDVPQQAGFPDEITWPTPPVDEE